MKIITRKNYKFFKDHKGMNLMNTKTIKKIALLLPFALNILLVYPAMAELKDASGKFSLGGFIDTYYTYDFNNPFDMNRAYTTQPLRHNEFNINLGFLDAKFTDENVRARLALHTGTYVDSNYAAEPQLLKNIFEASGGFKISDNIWIDAGIFPAHIGFEGAISKDNWNYSRSLMADYSPYYEAGIKLSTTFNDKLSGQLLILNGWQNIRETNSSKAAGLQLQYKPLDNMSITYNNFLGSEVPDKDGLLLRFFNNFIFQYSILPQWDAALIFDIGTQQKNIGGMSLWHTAALQSRYKITDKFTMAGRLEYYNDKDQIIVSTKTTNGFQVYSGSLNLDYNFSSNLLLRLEGRVFSSVDKIFPTSNKDVLSNMDSFIVSSIAVSF
jgi:hypothetical protein